MTNFDTFSAIPQFAPFARNRCKALMVMATGSGKTRTVIALCNRKDRWHLPNVISFSVSAQ